MESIDLALVTFITVYYIVICCLSDYCNPDKPIKYRPESPEIDMIEDIDDVDDEDDDLMPFMDFD